MVSNYRQGQNAILYDSLNLRKKTVVNALRKLYLYVLLVNYSINRLNKQIRETILRTTLKTTLKTRIRINSAGLIKSQLQSLTRTFQVSKLKIKTRSRLRIKIRNRLKIKIKSRLKIIKNRLRIKIKNILKIKIK